MKIIIAGGRDFNDYDLLNKEVSSILKSFDNIEIVSGMAKGADFLGGKYAYNNKLPIKKFPANWNLYGRSAGPIRNEEMAKYSDVLIAFWDGKSKGTMNMINNAKKYNLKTFIIKYEKS